MRRRRLKAMATIAVVACCDTKYHEIAFVSDCIRRSGHLPLSVDISTGPRVPMKGDITREEVLAAGGYTWDQIREMKKSSALTAMSESLKAVMASLCAQGRIQGALGMGGLQNSVVCSAAFRHLPIGFPKVICSTIACGAREFETVVGDKDIMVTPSIVDFAGINPINEVVLENAVAALIGMALYGGRQINTRGEKYTATTLMGVTNDTVMRASNNLSARGVHMISFHSTGIGGKVMEDMIRQGVISSVMDLSLHEMTAEYLGDFGYSRGALGRLTAAAEMGIPALIVPGGVDFACLRPGELLEDEEARGYVWHNKGLTHTRLWEHEILEITHTITKRLNRSRGPTEVLLPLGGLRTLSGPGELFHKPETLCKMRDIFQRELESHIIFKTSELSFCDPAFADLCADEMYALLGN